MSAYAELFATHPDAHRKDNEALRNFFRANTDAGDQALQKMVQTFKVLTEFGDFDAEVPTTTPTRENGAGSGEKPAAKKPVEQIAQGPAGMTLNVNIQLQLPATAESEVYEKLFAAMRKHLIELTQS
jgi:hypothetical protein